MATFSSPHMVFNTYQAMRADTAEWTAGRIDTLVFDGVQFTCFYEPSVLANQFCMQCEVLELLEPQDAQWLSLMLKDNWFRHQHQQPIFAVSPGSVRVQSFWNVPLFMANLAQVDQQLHAWVLDLKQWQLRFLQGSRPVVGPNNAQSRFFRGGKIA